MWFLESSFSTENYLYDHPGKRSPKYIRDPIDKRELSEQVSSSKSFHPGKSG
jgi:hypothetical protein